MTPFYYALTVLIWGTTWIGIKLQLGVVPVEVSIFYRFALATAVLFLVLAVSQRLKFIPLRHHPFLLLQALCLFSCNFLCFYYATSFVPSGLVSVVFSAAVVFNMINAALFHGRVPRTGMIAGALLGIFGTASLFLASSSESYAQRDLVLGLGLAALGTWFFSAGNLISARNTGRGLTVASANAWAMLYGAIILAVYVVARGIPFIFDPSPTYVWSWIYLAVPGSVVGFTAYLKVVSRLGPEKASYMTVLFPIIALAVSTVVEGYEMTILAGLGLLLVMAGNILTFASPRRADALT